MAKVNVVIVDATGNKEQKSVCPMILNVASSW